MDCIFLNAAGTTLFVRDDMEEGHWIQEQMNVTATFPRDPEKVIQFGHRIAFRDPATNIIEIFEIINVQNVEAESSQKITAEHICISELSDEHINKTEINNKTASQALTTALTGTLWSVGNNTASGKQTADFDRGSVWDAVGVIQRNWNVYITPRITISSAGAITGRYLDIAPAEGTWRGLRLSIRKNVVDPIVTYDESEVYTALYGYGGNVEKSQQTGDDKTEELTFKDEVWSLTNDHPAKPANQTYLEWPVKTAIYGRNGRPRYGYYQNANIKDAGVLLQKTWEALQKCCEPKISITGTCADLHRLKYVDQPIRLHDMAIVDIEETGERFYKQVICNDVDLVDPTNTRPEIGDYVPNIIYISRKTDKKASGGGGGGGSGMTNQEDDEIKTWTDFIRTNDKIGMVIGTKNGTDYIKAGEICLSINASGESTAVINANKIYLLGETIADTITADYISAKIAGLAALVAQAIAVSGGISCGGNITCSGQVGGSSVYANGSNIKDLFLDGISLSGPTDNVYTLYQSKNGQSTQVGTFSRAITSATASWSDGKVHMTLQPQGQTFNANLPSTASWSKTNNAPGSYTIYCTVAGKTYSQIWNDFTGT